MSLSPENLEHLQKDYEDLLTFYHTKVKEVVIACERQNRDQNISITAVNELRSAFEHVARAHAALYSLPPGRPLLVDVELFDYCHKNFDKAHGHLYRAAYDAYDAIAIALVDDIERLLNSISPTTLYTVLPNATLSVVNPFESAKKLVTKAKTAKDVTSKEEEAREFDLYEKATQDLFEVQTLLRDTMSAFSRYQEDQDKKNFRSCCYKVLAWAVSIAIAIYCTYVTVAAANKGIPPGNP